MFFFRFAFMYRNKKSLKNITKGKKKNETKSRNEKKNYGR